MGIRFPSITDSQIIRVLQKSRFEFHRQAKGSHEVWRRRSDRRHTIVPRHRGKIIKRRTLKSIISDMGLTVEEFRKLL
ncbi:type II toxin-antitoxin system HicA family toxin [bacterium]|nr:type II toxin-antitoxin system HicA family toxin [bacterium]